MGFAGLDPSRVRRLAALFEVSALDAQAVRTAIDRAVAASGLDSGAPRSLLGLAQELDHTAAVLRARADRADGLVLDLPLQTALLGVARAVTAIGTACVMGPTTMVGAASPCDPVMSVKVFALRAGALVPVLGVLGAKVNRAHIVRVEYLRSGRLRVTRIDEAAAGVALSPGRSGGVDAGMFSRRRGASATAWLQLLLARGDTYEIGASELDDFLVADVLDEIDRTLSALPLAVAGPGLGVVQWFARKAVDVIDDNVPLGKLRGIVDRLRRRIDWHRPAPVASYLEGGLQGGAGANIAGPNRGLPLTIASIGANTRGVIGVEQRPESDTLYLDLQGKGPARIAMQFLRVNLAGAVGYEARLGVVRDRGSGRPTRVELTMVVDRNSTVERHTAVIDLTDPLAQADVEHFEHALGSFTDIDTVLDSLVSLAQRRITVDDAIMHRRPRRTYGIDMNGNGVTYDTDELVTE